MLFVSKIKKAIIWQVHAIQCFVEGLWQVPGTCRAPDLLQNSIMMMKKKNKMRAQVRVHLRSR